MKIGFLVNPIAGMGGRVGLKGTDGVVEEALERGAEPIAQERASEAIQRYVELIKNQSAIDLKRIQKVEWFTCSDKMGEDILTSTGLDKLTDHTLTVVFELQNRDTTSAEDTKQACNKFTSEEIDLLVFCGGDGTARDIYSVLKETVPILGIPSGVKMHSGVFATHPRYAGELLVDYIKGQMDTADGEILDLDEDKYRKGEWNIRLFGVAKTPHEPTIIQRGKHMVESASEDEIKEEIAGYIQEEMESNTDILYIIGSGSTVETISKLLGVDGTLLGIDAVFQNKLVGKDMNEQELLTKLTEYPKAKLIISPIGAQGFILGRGNLQLSPAVIRKIGIENIDIVSTPAKLAGLEALKVDTNDTELDNEFATKGYLSVIIGYRQMKLKKVSV